MTSTLKDSKKMLQVLEQKSFDVEEFINVGEQELKVQIKKIRHTDFTDTSCIIVYWSGHGDGEALVAMDEKDPAGKILYE